jgi:hypothetical protein
MIKGRMDTALGQPVLFLGLSGENIARLTAGEPIRVSSADLARLGLPGMEVFIHYGRTEQAILDELKGHGVQLDDMKGKGRGD